MEQKLMLSAIEKIVKILRDKGSINPKELFKEVDTTDKIFYLALDFLKKLELVYLYRDLYYWYEFLLAIG